MKLIKEKSSFKYFPEENYEKFLKLQRAVKTACSSVDENEGLGCGDFVRGLNDTCKLEDKGEEQERANILSNIPSCFLESSNSLSYECGNNPYEWAKSADGRFERNSFSNEGFTPSRYQDEERHGGKRSHGRLSSASDPTIASRSKVKPEPRFQRVATSQLLSRMRRDSRLISRDPERFLQGIVEHGAAATSSVFNFSDHLAKTDSFTTLLSSFNKDPASESYRNSLQNLQEKCKRTKSRSLLLNLGANPAIRSKLSERSSNLSSRGSVTSEFSSYFGGETDKSFPNDILMDGGGDGENAEFVLQSFLDEIRCANVDNIVSWVKTVASLNDFDLPFGLPPSGVLQIPISNNQDLSKSSFSKCAVEFLRSAMEEFFLMDAEYHAKLEELVAKITDNFRELEQAAWAERDSALLFYLMSLTQHSGTHFSSERLCTEVASRIFPLYGREDIIAQKYKLKVKKALEEKRVSVIKQWLKDKETLVKKVNSAWEDIQKKERLQQDFQNERRIQQEKCQYWTELLEKMRKDNRKRVRAMQVLMEPILEEMRCKQELKDKLEKERRVHQKDLLERFQRLRLESQEEQKKRQGEIQAALEKDRKIRQIHNRTRVHLRRKEFEQKRATMKELEKRREEDKQSRMELLEKTKEKVEIAYNPASIVSDTHASFMRSVEIQQLIQLRDEDALKTVKFFQERYSFSAETLWKDSRVRLEAKLREAGLIDNSYARHVLLAMQPKEKPHLFSHIKFDD